jgi:hypothetical protein
MSGPDPDNAYPVPGHTRVGMLRPPVTPSNIEVGAFTYYDDCGPQILNRACARAADSLHARTREYSWVQSAEYCIGTHGMKIVEPMPRLLQRHR